MSRLDDRKMLAVYGIELVLHCRISDEVKIVARRILDVTADQLKCLLFTYEVKNFEDNQSAQPSIKVLLRNGRILL
ncbi:hypothetical protein EWB00_002653 [Schistosoma japonicum]|uniref:Uncharacterized protein n=1 Tax=Schistosoma japonicum TaxID=6182 RepID=A0A4Z2DC88_SCHJA|nr:hypothetical protein EWB00_002653 [Schistosoma japonicum]